MKLIVGNWKMNGLTADCRDRAGQLAAAVKSSPSFQMVLCPPMPMVGVVADILKGSAIQWGGQDCHEQSSGAFTGDTSAEMLKDLGCGYVIVGHSERRQGHKETSETVAGKAKAAHRAGLIAIICVGETDEERTAGRADQVISGQLKLSIPETATPENTVIAYEPIWAIGTGKTASDNDISYMHSFIQKEVKDFRILYGGSVKSSNAKKILHIFHVDGVLVGGASLKADEFAAIAESAGN